MSVWSLAWLFHMLNWEGVVVMVEMYGPTINAWHVSRPTVTTVSSCLKSFFVRRRCVISPCHSNYNIEFTEIDEFHKIMVRNLSLLFELFQASNVVLYSGKLYCCSWNGGCRWYHHRHRDGLSPQEPKNRCEKVFEAKNWRSSWHLSCYLPAQTP